MNAKRQTMLAVLSMAGLIVLWGVVTDAWNYSALLFSEHLRTTGKYLYGSFSRIIWVLPAVLLLRKFDQNLFWDQKQLFSKPKAEPVFIVFMVLTAVYALASMFLNHRALHITEENLPLLTVKLLMVGICEETVFRGWGYNLLRKVHSEAASLIISTFLFIVLHWPAYFIKLLLYGQFDGAGFAAQSLSALICGLLFAVMLKRSKTLCNPIIAHFYYDWMLEVFV